MEDSWETTHFLILTTQQKKKTSIFEVEHERFQDEGLYCLEVIASSPDPKRKTFYCKQTHSAIETNTSLQADRLGEIRFQVVAQVFTLLPSLAVLFVDSSPLTFVEFGFRLNLQKVDLFCLGAETAL